MRGASVLPDTSREQESSMTDVSGEQFNGFEHNSYQENMHTLAMWSLC